MCSLMKTPVIFWSHDDVSWLLASRNCRISWMSRELSLIGIRGTRSRNLACMIFGGWCVESIWLLQMSCIRQSKSIFYHSVIRDYKSWHFNDRLRHFSCVTNVEACQRLFAGPLCWGILRSKLKWWTKPEWEISNAFNYNRDWETPDIRWFNSHSTVVIKIT